MVELIEFIVGLIGGVIGLVVGLIGLVLGAVGCVLGLVIGGLVLAVLFAPLILLLVLIF